MVFWTRVKTYNVLIRKDEIVDETSQSLIAVYNIAIA